MASGRGAVQFGDRPPRATVQELAPIGTVVEELDDVVHRCRSIRSELDLHQHVRPLALQQLGGALQDGELVALDVDLDEPDVTEIEIVKASGHRLHGASSRRRTVRAARGSPFPPSPFRPTAPRSPPDPLRSLRATGWIVTLFGRTGSSRSTRSRFGSKESTSGTRRASHHVHGPHHTPMSTAPRPAGTNSSSRPSSGSKKRYCQATAGTTNLHRNAAHHPRAESNLSLFGHDPPHPRPWGTPPRLSSSDDRRSGYHRSRDLHDGRLVRSVGNTRRPPSPRGGGDTGSMRPTCVDSADHGSRGAAAAGGKRGRRGGSRGRGPRGGIHRGVLGAGGDRPT